MAIHEEMKKEEFKKIKELVYKISIIKKALIEERSKTGDFLSRIKEYENDLQEKESQIAAIKRESDQLEYQLNFEKTKKKSKKFTFNGVMDKIIHKDKYSKEQLDKLVEENQKLKSANIQMAHKMEEENELYLQDKINYETQLGLKANALSEIKKEIQVIQKINSKLQIDLQNISDKRQEYDLKKHKLEEEKTKKQNELNELKGSLSQIEQLKKDTDEDIQAKEVEINQLSKQLDDLTVKLMQAKTESLKKNLSKRVFAGKKAKLGGDLITFTFEQKENKYIMTIREDEINILNVTKFELNQDKKNRITIVYKKSDTKEKTLVIEVHESLTDKIIAWYRDFSSEAEKAALGE